MRAALIVLVAGVFFGAGVVVGRILKLEPGASPKARVMEGKDGARRAVVPAVQIGGAADHTTGNATFQAATSAPVDPAPKAEIPEKMTQSTDLGISVSKDPFEQLEEDAMRAEKSIMDSAGLTEVLQEQVRSQMETERAEIIRRMRGEIDAVAWEEYRVLKGRPSHRLLSKDREKVIHVNDRFKEIQEQVLGQWDGASAYQGLTREQREKIQILRGGVLDIGREREPALMRAIGMRPK